MKRKECLTGSVFLSCRDMILAVQCDVKADSCFDSRKPNIVTWLLACRAHNLNLQGLSRENVAFLSCVLD